MGFLNTTESETRLHSDRYYELKVKLGEKYAASCRDLCFEPR